jgi:soluble lytic murein transglycosylase-like protein
MLGLLQNPRIGRYTPFSSRACARWLALGLLTFVAALEVGLAAGGAVRSARPYQHLIEQVAEEHAVEPALLSALVEVESARRADAVSPKGARGLGQLMPATAERFGVADPHDPEDNLRGSAQYLRWLLERYGGDVRLALAAYNAGEGTVDRYGGVPPFPETRQYVRRVLQRVRGHGGSTRFAAGSKVRLSAAQNGTLVITNQP